MDAANPAIALSDIAAGDDLIQAIDRVLPPIDVPSVDPVIAFGGRKDAVLAGGLNDDSLFGRRGDDELMGLAGDDLPKGGRGLDTFRLTEADGANVIRDFARHEVLVFSGDDSEDADAVILISETAVATLERFDLDDLGDENVAIA